MTDKFVPEPTPESAHFWDSATAEQLVVQNCNDCERPYFYPRPFCPGCGGSNVEWMPCSGYATLYSYVINHRPAQGFEAPYVIAIVALAEGPHLLSNIVNVDPIPQNLPLDMPLRVVFTPRGNLKVPLFEPASAVAGSNTDGSERDR